MLAPLASSLLIFFSILFVGIKCIINNILIIIMKQVHNKCIRISYMAVMVDIFIYTLRIRVDAKEESAYKCVAFLFISIRLSVYKNCHSSYPFFCSLLFMKRHDDLERLHINLFTFISTFYFFLPDKSYFSYALVNVTFP